MKNIKPIVERILKVDPYSRCNDMYLQYLVLKELGLPTDLAHWSEFDSNVLESIRRCRQKLQAGNYQLKCNNRTQKAREGKEKAFREFARE